MCFVFSGNGKVAGHVWPIVIFRRSQPLCRQRLSYKVTALSSAPRPLSAESAAELASLSRHLRNRLDTKKRSQQQPTNKTMQLWLDRFRLHTSGTKYLAKTKRSKFQHLVYLMFGRSHSARTTTRGGFIVKARAHRRPNKGVNTPCYTPHRQQAPRCVSPNPVLSS